MLHSVRFACSNDGSASWPGTAVFSCTAMRAKKTSFQCTRTTLKTAKSSATAVPSATGVSSATDWGCSTFYFAFPLFLPFPVQHSAAWNSERSIFRVCKVCIVVWSMMAAPRGQALLPSTARQSSMKSDVLQMALIGAQG